MEDFDEEKLRRSLRRAGADEVLVGQILEGLSEEIQEGMQTKSIFKHAFRLLKRLHRPSAARYNLKQAMFDFGNSGYPFEDFFAALLQEQGYKTKVRQRLPGLCIEHEVDVVAENENKLIWVECKYHPLAGSVSNVKIPLYIHSRFRDLEAGRNSNGAADPRPSDGWIVTNSRFSEDAILYGHCAGMKLIAWNYPASGSLREMVDDLGLFPITCLTTLTRSEKSRLLEQGIVLCKNLLEGQVWADSIFLSPDRKRHVQEEARQLCQKFHPSPP